MTTFSTPLAGSIPLGSEFYFGNHLILNLYGCDGDVIRDGLAIERYAVEAVNLLKMKAYGPPMVQHFGHESPITSGYTLVQLIETSNITGHFSDAKLSAYLDIFSCQPFDMVEAREHAADFFHARRGNYMVLDR